MKKKERQASQRSQRRRPEPTGCRASSIAQSAAVEEHCRLSKGQSNLEDALFMSKASARDFTKAMDPGSSRALRRPVKFPDCADWRAPADCFGANPVASALDNPAGRDPGEAVRTLPSGPDTGLQDRNFLLPNIALMQAAGELR